MMDPVLSVVVAIVSDTVSGRPDCGLLRESLGALSRQNGAPGMEIVVPYLENTTGISSIREEFPAVTFVAVPESVSAGRLSREHHDVLRARGLARARGSLVAMIEDHGVPAPDWAAAMQKAHAGQYAAVGGAMENRIDRALNWAVYFSDFAAYQNPLPEGPAGYASDANVAYKRSELWKIRQTWSDSYREPAVHEALRAQGMAIALCSAAVVQQNRRGLTLGEAVLERYVWGRSYALTRRRLISNAKRFLYACLCPALPVLAVARCARRVLAKGRSTGALIRSTPSLCLLAVAWAAGEFAGYLAAGDSPSRPK